MKINNQKVFTPATESILKNNDVIENEKGMYVTCPFLYLNTQNENNRYYLKSAAEPEVNRIIEEEINCESGNKAVMELEHPPIEDDELYYRISTERGSSKIVDLNWDGDVLMGKYKVLLHLPLGATLAGYHKEDIPIGVSVRSLVSYLDKNEKKAMKINESFDVVDVMKIITWDNVLNPGFDNARRLSVAMESKQFVLDNIDNKFVPLTESNYKYLENNLKTLPKKSSSREEYFERLLKNYLLKY